MPGRPEDSSRGAPGWLRGWEFLALSLFSLAYFSHCLALVRRKPLWNDELFSLYLSQFESFSALIDTLRLAADQQPPLFYLLTRLSLSIPGGTQVAIRLPEIAGVWIACLCVYAFLRRRTGPLAALCGLLTMTMGRPLYFAAEARPYGLVLGVFGVLLLCWQAAAEERRRRWLPLLAICVFLLGSLHYLAPLALAPLLGAEAWRRYQTGRWDWPVLLALGAGAAALLVYVPLLLEIRKFSTVFWSQPTFAAAIESTATLYFPPYPLLLTLLLLALAPAGWIFVNARSAGALTPREACLVCGLVLMAVVGPPLIHEAAGGYVFRYVPFLSMGWALLAGWVVSRLEGGRRLVMPAILAVFLAGSAATVYFQRNLQMPDHGALPQTLLQGLLARQPAPSLVLVDSPLTFLEFWHGATEQERQRIRYAVSPEAALRYTGTDSPEQSLARLARTIALPAMDPRELPVGEPFLLLRTRRPPSWIGAALARHSARQEIMEEEGRAQLIRVTQSSPLVLDTH